MAGPTLMMRERGRRKARARSRCGNWPVSSRSVSIAGLSATVAPGRRRSCMAPLTILRWSPLGRIGPGNTSPCPKPAPILITSRRAGKNAIAGGPRDVIVSLPGYSASWKRSCWRRTWTGAAATVRNEIGATCCPSWHVWKQATRPSRGCLPLAANRWRRKCSAGATVCCPRQGHQGSSHPSRGNPAASEVGRSREGARQTGRGIPPKRENQLGLRDVLGGLRVPGGRSVSAS